MPFGGGSGSVLGSDDGSNGHEQTKSSSGASHVLSEGLHDTVGASSMGEDGVASKHETSAASDGGLG